MQKILLVHYSEIGTKGKNRSFFERCLVQNIRRKLSPEHIQNVRVESGRISAELTEKANPDIIHGEFRFLFGVAWYALADVTTREWEDIFQTGLRCVENNLGDKKTFKVFCRRADKTYPITSQDICNRLGEAIRKKFGLKVNLDHHDLALSIEILPKRTCVFAERFPGRRGLPIGTAGRVLCLFSGGIDSPVAAFRLMRRGAHVDLVHFHPFRKGEEVKETKIFPLHQALQRFDPGVKLILIPHFPYQIKAALEVNPDYEMVLFRRFIALATQTIAERGHWQGLVTGDSLGQVASQTLENMAAAQNTGGFPVFRPLISFDKEEIVEMAKDIDTYDLSNLPYKDCCSLMSRHPKTRAKKHHVAAIEKKLDFPKLVEDSLALAEMWDGKTLKPFKIGLRNKNNQKPASRPFV